MTRKGFAPIAVLAFPAFAMAFQMLPEEEAAIEKSWGFYVDLSVFIFLVASVFVLYLFYALIRKYIFKRTSPGSWLADLSIIFGLLSVVVRQNYGGL